MAQDDTGNQDITNKPLPYPDAQKVGTDQDEQPKPRTFRPGDLAPFWYSPFPNVLDKLSEKARNELKRLVDEIGNKDVAARRWEVEQSWEARLFDRGYQYLLPRRGGGWILPPFATDYNRTSSKRSGKFYGYETNIYATYGEIITAALTRDVPGVRFEPKNPESDIDVTAKDAATRYAKCFGRSNDLLAMHQQLAYYLRTDGRAIIVTDHVVDRQRFGSLDPINPVNPETETQEEQALLYLVRHGETPRNEEGVTRGQSDIGLDRHGQQEASDAGAYLKGKSIGRIVSSPLPRSVESAERISQITGVPVEMDDRFAARDIGDLEGQQSEDVAPAFEESSDNPTEPLPGGGESQEQLDGRVQQAILEHLQTPQERPTAIVTHDSVISSAFRAIHGEEYVPPTDMVDPGGVAGIFAAPGGGFTIRPVFPTTAEHGAVPTEESEPRGEEVSEVYGKLEGKVPINAQTQADFPWLQVSREYDYAFVKAMFPESADKIKPGQAGAGENELDRIARINACLALEASYVTGDSMVRDCTVQRTWMRPGYFMGCDDTEVRDELFKYFPNGCIAIMAGEAMVLARNENLDDHCTTIQAFPGSGMNRLALCSKLLSLQKRVNNWIDLWNDYFIRTIPNRIYDIDMYNPEAMQDQTAMPGDSLFVKRSGANLAMPIETSVFVEPTPTHQASMPQAIQMFLTDLPQLLVGAVPSLFGAQSNVDTLNPSSGVAMSLARDQALARLSTPWHAIMMATCNYFRQAVQLAAKCRKEPIRMAGQPGEAVRIELSDLKGNVLCYPEESYDIPESWNQRQARYQGMITEAATNPYLAQLLAAPQNAKLAHDAAGMEEFIIPQADAWEKQLGEFEVLLKSSPIPNPAKIQAQQQMEQMIAAAQTNPQAIPPGAVTGADQMIQQIQSMPDMISSVQVDPQVDDSATESACCQWWLNSSEGRKYKNGTPEERDGFQNVRLHKIEHDAAMKNNVPPAPQKPMSVSANIKDMPPKAAAAELTKRGLPAAPQEIAAERSAKNG